MFSAMIHIELLLSLLPCLCCPDVREGSEQCVQVYVPLCMDLHKGSSQLARLILGL